VTFATKLRILRVQRKATLRDVSVATGLSISHLSEIERGGEPSFGTIKALATYYKLRPIDLVIATEEWGVPTREKR